jgi:hypothetical protein
MSRRNAKQKRRQGKITLLPPPTDKNCIDAIFIWKSNKGACQSNLAPRGQKTKPDSPKNSFSILN